MLPLAEVTSRYAESAEWRAFRPRVIVIEAIAPLSFTATWFEWDGLLFEAGYEFALFDGINRFYHRAEEPELRQALSMPANVLDNYVTSRCKSLQDQVAAMEARLAALTAEQDASRPAA